MTLPLIHLRDQLSESGRRELRQLLEEPTSENVETLISWLQDRGSLEYSRSQATNHVEQAIRHLESLGASDAKRTLEQIAKFSAYRDA